MGGVYKAVNGLTDAFHVIKLMSNKRKTVQIRVKNAKRSRVSRKAKRISVFSKLFSRANNAFRYVFIEG